MTGRVWQEDRMTGEMAGQLGWQKLAQTDRQMHSLYRPDSLIRCEFPVLTINHGTGFNMA